jgi:hypothetical protein
MSPQDVWAEFVKQNDKFKKQLEQSLEEKEKSISARLSEVEKKEKQLKEQEKQMKQIEERAMLREQEIEEHVKVWTRLLEDLEERARVLDELSGRINKTNAKVVKLNIGGTIFQTTYDTLTKYPDSYFAVRFNGNFTSELDESGAHFIDRKPGRFDIILDHLRGEDDEVQTAIKSLTPNDRATLIRDVGFYGIYSLMEQLTVIFDSVYTRDYDNNGILYWLGTQRGTAPYTNPHNSGKVIVSSSSNGAGCDYSHVVCNNSNGTFYTNNASNSFVVIDFRPSNIEITPTYYTISDGRCGYSIRSWVLQGSQDGIWWDTIKEHFDDMSIIYGSKHTQSWNIECTKPYSMFRLYSTGPNHMGNHFFAVSGFEIYGTVNE